MNLGVLQASNVFFKFKRLSSSQESLNYCIKLVKQNDYDHFLCTLLLPKNVQASVFALRAFNVEVAQIKDSVSESRIGKLRIQFWRDRIDSIFKGETVPKHPVVVQLAQSIHAHSLNKVWLNRVLDAREKDLTSSAFYTTSDLELYCEYTSSSLLYLTLQTLGIQNVDADHAASHIGKAAGIVTILRATQYHRLHRKVLLPMDILARHGASQEDFIRGSLTKSVENSVFDCACLADAHLKKARALQSSISSSLANKAFLSATVSKSFLDRLQHFQFNIFDPKLGIRDSLLPVKLLWKSFKKLL